MRIICLLDNDYEDSEFQQPYEAFRAAGHEVTITGIKTGEVNGKKGTSSAMIQKTVDQVSPQEFDAMFIPGGYSPDKLRASQNIVDFVFKFGQSDGAIFAICHAPQLLLTANAINGRTLTAWRTVQDDLKRCGEDVVDAAVVVDEGLVTSRQPSDIPAFIEESLAILHKPMPAMPAAAV